ncbi:hypothetical protein RF55_13931, partial [Lasius niger]
MSMDRSTLLAGQHEILGRISRQVDNLKKLGSDNITLSAVETRTRIIDQLWNKLEAQHELIRASYKEKYNESEYATSDFFDNAENTYVLQRSLLAEYAERFKIASAAAPPREPHSDQAPKTSLPRIKLQQFSGAYEDWPAFRDLFLSVIGENTAISNVERLHYLRSCLQGPAEKLIRSLAVTGDNYNRAWSLLSKHYENKKELIRSNFAAFTAVTKMKGETAEELSRIHQAVTTAVSAQESIGRPIHSNGMDLFNHLVVELFDPRTRLEWESSTSDSSDPPSHDTLMNFIAKRTLTLNAARPKNTAKVSGDSSRSAKAHFTKRGFDSSQCALCKEKHSIMVCRDFKAKPGNERKAVIEKSGLCYNCFGNHPVAKCQSSKNCSTCKARHHTMIHDAYVPPQSAEAPKYIHSSSRKGGPEAPFAQKIILGWILSGGCGAMSLHARNSSLQCTVDHDLTELVHRFWEQEKEPAAPVALTPEEERCEEFFARTHQRTKTGRYLMRLPFSATPTSLAETRKPAERLLTAIERKGRQDARFGELYRSFMQEYEDLQHMELVEQSTNKDYDQRQNYLPHHGVLRESSITTKLRVVFNGSQRTRTGESLNSHLLVGANLLPALSDVLLRWRWHKYVLVTDIEKMYRQIIVHPEDRDWQRILWRHDVAGPVREYRLKTVTYGLACAPFLAIRTLKQLANDEEARYPHGAISLRRDCYVDDIVTGASTLSDAIATQSELRELCMAGGFPLRKWAANCEDILAGIPQEHRLQRTPHSWEGECHSTLGLRWHPLDDHFTLSTHPRTITEFTKRRVLSETARLFDPMGWLAPVVIRAKILIQSAWLRQLDWDAPLPSADALQWQRFFTELPQLEKIRVNRWLGTGVEDVLLELHGFADASERGYAAAVYLRVEANDSTSLHLLAAKSKVAPVKQVSLPRLELCAAALLTVLTAHLRTSLNLSTAPVHLWTDSKVTLHWIQGHASRWKTYVANRVSQIQVQLPEAQWRHVPGRDNPADCASRGISPNELLEHRLWWTGPAWLTKEKIFWPNESCDAPDGKLPEERPATCCNADVVKTEPEFLLRFSSLHRLLRVTAWCCRWRRPSTRPPGGVESPLQPDELEDALLRWLRIVQRLHFPAEVAAIAAKRTIPSRSSILKLSPFLDENNVLRVGGRLKHAVLSRDERHPMIVPTSSWLTRLLVESRHRQTLHGGTQLTLGLLRLKFWIPRGRTIVKQVLHRCVTCIRWRASTPQPVMSDLPRGRVTAARPFLRTGVDYAGPILIRTSKGRGQRAHKAFISVFVCLSTKAVHLDVVSDYTTEAFLAAFRRFVSRRGLCEEVYSDCGTNFVGADRELRELFRASSSDGRRIAHAATTEGVRWHFNPPSAPHFGGLWEAAVKSAKHHLRRVIGESTLTYEEMSTLLAQV